MQWAKIPRPYIWMQSHVRVMHALRNQTKEHLHESHKFVRDFLHLIYKSIEENRAKKNCIYIDLHKSSVIAAREDRQRMIVCTIYVQNVHAQFDRCGIYCTALYRVPAEKRSVWRPNTINYILFCYFKWAAFNIYIPSICTMNFSFRSIEEHDYEFDVLHWI